MLSKKLLSVCAFIVIVKGQENGSTTVPASSESPKLETSTYKYPTATWSAKSYELTKKKYDPDMMIKLFLFKPSPFLKPPFTDGSVGPYITTIEDSVNVSGRRRGKIKSKKNGKSIKKPVIQKLEVREPKENSDAFLQQALMNYIKSANLTDEFGSITVEEFSEALRRITENRKNIMIYEENKDMRKKFRDEVLSPKRLESTSPSGILEKQYQRRLQKTWEVINENISVPSRSATLDSKINWEMGKPVEIGQTQMKPAQDDSTTSQYLFSHITQPTPSLMASEVTKSYDNWSSSETGLFDYYPTEAPKTEQSREKFRLSETGWRNVITTSTTETFLEPPTKIVDTNEISLTTSESIEIVPTTFRPVLKKKPNRGKKKWRDTLPAAQERHDLEEGEVKLSVAETVYYRPRQTQLESFNYQRRTEYGAIPGEPERDYPMFGTAPVTGFKCPEMNGESSLMLADRKARCQVFYICTGEGPPSPMLCPNGTLFNENVLVCDWWYNVDC